MKRPGDKLSDEPDPDDAALFRAAVGAVSPLADQNRVTLSERKRKPVQPSAPGPAIPDTLSDHGAEEAPDDYLSNGLARMTLRKLRRGTWPIQDTLDLHGCTSDTARQLLQAFLAEALQRGLRCVLLIHGKGHNSQHGEAVLRKLTRHWLLQHPAVLAYCDAQPKDGGSGAVLALLKSSR